MTDQHANYTGGTRKLAVLTGGGDAQGMNAALRAVSRVALGKGWEVYGIRDGFYGLYRLTGIEDPNETIKRPGDTNNQNPHVVDLLDWEYMSWSIRDGGSLLGTIRYDGLRNSSLQESVVKKLTNDPTGDPTGNCGLGIKALIVIGGNGSLRGAHALAQTAERLGKTLSVVVVPASIDNDIPGTEISVGVDSALNVIIQSIDKLTDTSSAVNRAIVVETMGRECGYLAVFGALASAAEDVFSPERPIEHGAIGELLVNLTNEYAAGRRSAVIVVGEGSTSGARRASDYVVHSTALANEQGTNNLAVNEIPWDVRRSELGHLQRGGPASAFDRVLATRMGAHAVNVLDQLDDVERSRMVALRGAIIDSVRLEDVVARLDNRETAISSEALKEHGRLVRTLSRMPDTTDRSGCLALLTGGTDAQGMNMAIRAITRYALNEHNLEIRGFKNGFAGLIQDDEELLTWDAVSTSRGDFRRAGSILGAKRQDTFNEEQKECILKNLRKLKRLKGLIVIGDLATALRAGELQDYFEQREAKIPIIYVPASIDHGLPVTHATIGFDTALNLIVESCDRITDTSSTMDRVAMVNTMGGGVGALTLIGALAAGAECAIVKENLGDFEGPTASERALKEMASVLESLKDDMDRYGRLYATVLLQFQQFGEFEIARLHGQADQIFKPHEVRRTELGYIQRGGNASYYDRLLGTLMGVEAVKAILQNKYQAAMLLALIDGHIIVRDLRAELAPQGGGSLE